MGFGGLHADAENLRDLLGGLALDHQMKSLALACGQAFVRVVAVMARTMMAFSQRLGRKRTEIGLVGAARFEQQSKSSHGRVLLVKGVGAPVKDMQDLTVLITNGQ